LDPRFGVDSVGTVPAAIATYAALTALKPDLLLNAGTAGGFKARRADGGGGVDAGRGCARLARAR
jgi:5'-methylthioadenosine nucleosidase